MKQYVVSFDGGGTKTDIAVFDIRGKLYYYQRGPGSNHAALSEESFIEIMSTLYHQALLSLDIDEELINLVVLGLSGADMKEDFMRLERLSQRIFKAPFIVLNDAWLILRSALKDPFGAVAICGTGTNSAAINKKGEMAILRSLNYITGTFGGGLDIAREALHYAYRAEENSYLDTKLKNEIPQIFGFRSLEELVAIIYPVNKISKSDLSRITALVFKLSEEGDLVSQMILRDCGKAVGEQTCGVSKSVGITNDFFPVVVGGRVFRDQKSEFFNSFFETLKSQCPKTEIVIPKYLPVVGGFFIALDKLFIKQTASVENNIDLSVRLI